MTKKRHQYSAEFKFKVALEATKGAKTINGDTSISTTMTAYIRRYSTAHQQRSISLDLLLLFLSTCF